MKVLYDTRFRVILSRDINRLEDGESLRYRYQYENNIVDDYLESLTGSSILEVMTQITFAMEEIVYDGSHTQRQSFFNDMLYSLGLDIYDNNNFDINRVNHKLDHFLARKYNPDGVGGLFTIKNCEKDLRTVEIWYQACWWLNTVYNL